jgi:hypothetical protein
LSWCLAIPPSKCWCTFKYAWNILFCMPPNQRRITLFHDIFYVPDIAAVNKLNRKNSAYFPNEFCSHGQDKSSLFITVLWNGMKTLTGKPIVLIKLQCHSLTLNPSYFIVYERHKKLSIPYKKQVCFCRSSEYIPVMEILHSSEPSDLQYLRPSHLLHKCIYIDS